jgi:hypothetical protein
MTEKSEQMSEYRTKPIDRLSLLAELQFVCEKLATAGFSEVTVSLGWGSKMPIGDMWQDQAVAVGDVAKVVANSEESGISSIGKSDILVGVPRFRLTLCHDGDVHAEGDSPLVGELNRRWQSLGYEPYEVKPKGQL